MPASAEETAALLGRVPVFEALADEDLRRVAEVTVPAAVRRRRGRLPRGRRLGHLLRGPRRPRARDPRAPRRPPDHAGDVRPGRHLRRAGDVRRRAPLGDRRGDRRRSRCSASSAATCGGCCAGTPTWRSSSSSRSAAGCGRPTSGSRGSPSRPCRAASPPCSPSSSSRRRPRARPSATSRRRHAGRPRPARRLLARVGQPLPRRPRAGRVITQGRGRLTVHDPARCSAMSSDRPLRETLLRRRRASRAATRCS